MKKKYIIIALVIVLGLALCGYVYARNLPVDYDAGACSGGYDSFIFDKYSEELTDKYFENHADKDKISSVKAIKGTQSADWADKTISLSFNVEYEHSSEGKTTETLHFQGERVWFDTYEWNKGQVK